MSQPRWLLEQTIIAVQSILLKEHGGATGIRDEDMLASALNRPIDKYNYNKGCTLFELAAAYSFGLAKNHAFVDGNKRIAFVAGTIFLELNGYEFKASEPDATIMFENLAASKVAEDELASWFERNSSSA